MTKIDDLRAMFPPDTQLPDALAKLCAYSEQTAGRISCDFRLTANAYVADQLFRDVEGGKQHVAIFGRDGMQSYYGYWLYEGRALDRSPIVYLHHEGVGTAVLANTLEDFFALLALGYREVGLVANWTTQTPPCDGIDAFRTWLRREFGIKPTVDGRTLVTQAQQVHPDFDGWLKEERARFGAQGEAMTQMPSTHWVSATTFQQYEHNDEEGGRTMDDTPDVVPPVVRAQAFELVNAEGQTRAVLGTLDDLPLLGFADASGVQRAALLLDADGSPGLFLRDREAQVRAGFYVEGDVPVLELLHATDGNRIEARVDDVGAHVTLHDRDDTIRAGLSMRESGEPALSLQDASGAIRLSAAVGDDGTPTLSLQDAGGAPRALLGLRADGAPVLYLHDALGHLRLSVDVDAQGIPSLVLRDQEGQVTLAVASLATGPAVSLHDPSGAPRAALGLVDSTPAILTTNAQGGEPVSLDHLTQEGGEGLENNHTLGAQEEAATRLVEALQGFVATLRRS